MVRTCRRTGILARIVLIGLLPPFAAHAADVTWTGAVDTDWANAGNWTGSAPPGVDDVAIVPLTANQPVIDAPATGCGGVILETGATIETVGAGALLIIGDGDLDGDGTGDGDEWMRGLLEGNQDADLDGTPNIDETDSDDDTLSDACEFANLDVFLPYTANIDSELDEVNTGPNEDFDGDGFTNAEECEEGTDPDDESKTPPDLPVGGLLVLVTLTTLLAVFALLVFRRIDGRGRRAAAVVLILAAGLALGYLGIASVQAGAGDVDFADGDILHEHVNNTPDGQTVNIDGASARPWNGSSTYVMRPVIVRANGGTVYLGTMEASLQVSINGDGHVRVESDLDGSAHPAPLDRDLLLGSLTTELFLGERLTLTAETPGAWGFRTWTGAVTDTTNPLELQISDRDVAITAEFGALGSDLLATLDTGPPSTPVKPGDMFSIVARIENIGLSATEESAWDDGLFLSRDARFDDADYRLSPAQARASALAAGANYTVSFSVTVPDVAPGSFHVIAVADGAADVTEDNEENNTAGATVVVLDANLAQ